MNDNDQFDYHLVPSDEIFHRISRLQDQLHKTTLDGALILDPLNMYYYTGTIQQGVLYVPVEGEPLFLIRRSLERAQRETPLERVLPLKGLRTLKATLADFNAKPQRLGVDESSISVSIYHQLKRSFSDGAFEDISFPLAMVRAVKSDYEVALIREAGLRHAAIYEQIPAMVREGMTEWQLGAAIHAKMLDLEYTGITRLTTYGAELFMGVISFGESGNYPTASVGPGGLVGLSPAFPLVGGHKKLRKGEPIFVDTGFGYEGYFVDKTRIFVLGPPPGEVEIAHGICLEIQEAIRCRLKPGAIPSQIFDEVLQEKVHPRAFEEHFMGFSSNQVFFLGHGIGLAIDEFPAIAGKVHTPLEANMVIALEPKKGLEGIGLVGIENTFLVTDRGGEKLTPGADEIVIV